MYAKIVEDITRRIESGDLAPGDRVPSTRQIVAEYGVAMATATKALSALRQQGLVHARPGIGTVVADRRRGKPSDAEPSRERLVRKAIEVADAEGLSGVSMRRIATELGIATMSLYRYVQGRDDLIALMVDAAIGERQLPSRPPKDWRARLEASARLMWAGCKRHPWLAHGLNMTRPQVIPNGMDHTEWALAALDGYRLDMETRMHLAIGLFNYVRGVAVGIEPELRAEQDTGMTDEEWMDSRQPAFHAVVGPSRYPHLAGAVRTDLDITLDSTFEFGLARLLDGYATFLKLA